MVETVRTLVETQPQDDRSPEQKLRAAKVSEKAIQALLDIDNRTHKPFEAVKSTVLREARIV